MAAEEGELWTSEWLTLPMESAIVMRRALPRAALALPNLLVADDVAAEWGEAVWTHPVDYKLAALGRTPVSLSDLRIGQLDPRPPGCVCTPVGNHAVVLELGCPLHGHIRGYQLACADL